MNDKTRAAMQKALNLIEGEWPEDDEIAKSVINEIREALEQSVGQEPVRDSFIRERQQLEQEWCELRKLQQAYTAPQPVSQEPVAWMHEIDRDQDGRCSFTVYYNQTPGYCIPLYTTPVRTKDMTDDEIEECVHIADSECTEDACMPWFVEFARAVIAADREKNK